MTLFMSNTHQNIYLATVTLICVSIMLLPTHIREGLYLNIALAQQGEYWRYITGHFAHYSWLHCISNLFGLYLLFRLFKLSEDYRHWLIATSLIIGFVSFGLALSSETLKWYVGFSGVLTGLLVYASVRTFSQNAILSITFLLVIVTYVFNQALFGGELIRSTMFSEVQTSSYAHAYGLIGGLLYGVSYTVKHHIDLNFK